MNSIWLAFVLDAVMGDPYWMPHPVRFMGSYIKFYERQIRKYFKSYTALKLSGVFLTISLTIISYFTVYFALKGLKHINLWLYYGVNVILLYTCLAARCLSVEAIKIYKALYKGDIVQSRKLLSYIVGRDTESLDEGGITRAAIETVAENTSDGVIAPLLYMFIGGAPLAMAYKAINTLDSMVGYKNDKYLYFGWASAKLDDIANFIPARLTALFMIICAGFLKLDWKSSLRIFIRDRKNHKSPNSGCPEAATAGALGIQLGGTSNYFGKPVVKPTIGDACRKPVGNDILGTIKLMYGASILAVVVFSLVSGLSI